MSHTVFSDNEWFRYGRGHYFSFYATQSEISNYIRAILSETDEECYVCGTDFVPIPGSKQYQEISFQYPISHISECLEEHCDSINFWVGSEKIVSRDKLTATNSFATISINGLICLQCFFRMNDRRNGRIPPCNISIVSHIFNMVTQAEIKHLDHYNIYKKIKKFFWKHLPFHTVLFATDHEDRSCRMSYECFRLWQSGVPYEHDPMI